MQSQLPTADSGCTESVPLSVVRKVIYLASSSYIFLESSLR